MPDNCILININKKYERGKGENAIYNATKGIWAIKKSKLIDKNGVVLRKYVLSEYKGLIVEVFEVKNGILRTGPITQQQKSSELKEVESLLKEK